MLHLRPKADHIQMNLRTFYCCLIMWAHLDARTVVLCSALQSAKQECWAQRCFWTLPLLLGAWVCPCGCRALRHSPSAPHATVRWDSLPWNRLKIKTVRQWLWCMRKPESSVAHHFTRQPRKFSHQVVVSLGHERDASWKQPVLSVSGRCAQGTGIEPLREPSAALSFHGVKGSCS